jgi:hypothetical protein
MGVQDICGGDDPIQLMAMDIGSLIGLWMQTLIIGITMVALNIIIFVIIYGRMVEIFL